MSARILNLHAFVPMSWANGPGTRAVIWVQSCSLGCPGCYNPDTHPLSGGELVEVDDLFRQIVVLGDSIEGVTVSGGEPLQQLPALLPLLVRLRAETALTAILFTGYNWDEVQVFPGSARLLACIDVLIAGRYDARRRLAAGLRGSSNKTVHFLTGRYSAADLDAVAAAEVHIGPAGAVEVSGIDPPRWRVNHPERNP